VRQRLTDWNDIPCPGTQRSVKSGGVWPCGCLSVCVTQTMGADGKADRAREPEPGPGAGPRIVTFNCHCAPTMRGRYSQLNNTERAIKAFDEEGYDMVVLQELYGPRVPHRRTHVPPSVRSGLTSPCLLPGGPPCPDRNDIRAGPVFGSLLFVLLWLGLRNAYILQAIELLAEGEGALLPLMTIDVAGRIAAYAGAHTRFGHALRSAACRWGLNGGQLVLSRHAFIRTDKDYEVPADDDGGSAGAGAAAAKKGRGPDAGAIAVGDDAKHNGAGPDADAAAVDDGNGVVDLLLPPDTGNRPSLLSASIWWPAGQRVSRLRLVTLHLLPTLPNTTFSYVLVNSMNSALCCDSRRLRHRHARIIKRVIARSGARTDPHCTLAVCGDLNIALRSDYERFLEETDLIDGTVPHTRHGTTPHATPLTRLVRCSGACACACSSTAVPLRGRCDGG
jgi:hypothetical protein